MKNLRKKGDCILFVGSKDKDGYGHLTYKRKVYKAHRFAWTHAYGIIPKGMYVLHKCDNPPCVNPDHLYLGDQLDNVRDMDLKGRNNFGRVAIQVNGRKFKSLGDVSKFHHISRGAVTRRCSSPNFPKWIKL
tara:strand:+ start:2950 stop:3345 length:396 start_codon:yes stop_codon:yes gene_type:complete